MKVVSAKVSRLSEAIAGENRAAKAAYGKPPQARGSKIFVSKAEELRRKGIYPVVTLFLLLRRIWVVMLL